MKNSDVSKLEFVEKLIEQMEVEILGKSLNVNGVKDLIREYNQYKVESTNYVCELSDLELVYYHDENPEFTGSIAIKDFNKMVTDNIDLIYQTEQLLEQSNS